MTALKDPAGVQFELFSDEVGTGLTLVEALALLAGADTSVFGVPKITVAAAEVHTGAMIALLPSAADADRLALNGFEDLEQLHVTLVYLGDAANFSDETRQLITDTVRRYATAPVEARAFAVNLFNPIGDEPCLVIGVGSDDPELENLRSNIYSAARGLAGVEIPENHTPWIPHVTLAYADLAQLVALVPQAAERLGPVNFDRVRVAFGGDNVDLPLRKSTSEVNNFVPEFDLLLDNYGVALTASLLEFHTPGGHPHNQQSHAGDRVMSTAKLTARVKNLENALASNTKLATNYTHQDKYGVWDERRDAIHREIVADMYTKAKNVPSDGRALLLGGNAGAGKSTVIQEQAGVDLGQFLKIDPDEVKEELARRGLIPELPDGDYSPMERSTLVHRESVRIADMLADRAMRDGKNIIWDGTMANPALVLSRVDRMRRAGYDRIDGIFVDVTDETSRRRVRDRYRRGLHDWVRGNGQGSRFVPSAIQSMMTSGDTRYGFKKIHKKLDNWAVYDNNSDGKPAELLGSQGEV